VGQAFDCFSPFAPQAARPQIFTDQRAGKRVCEQHCDLAVVNANLSFNFDPVTGAGEFKVWWWVGQCWDRDDIATTLDAGPDRHPGDGDGPGGLAITDTFFIDVIPPTAHRTRPTNLHHAENVGLTTLPSTGAA
jgi:hypothetical protein